MIDILIVGAGPAGLQAAITLAKQDRKVTIIDEYMKAGGRLLGQLYEEPKGGWWNGIEQSDRLYKEALSLGVSFHLQTSVFDLEKNEEDHSWHVHTTKGTFTSKYLLLATGAAEQSFALPGWTLPGVMSVGAAQVMTNVQRVQPGDKGIVVGMNVLSAAIAMELMLADVELAGIALPAMNDFTEEAASPLIVMESLLHVAHMAPSKFIQYGSKLMKGDLLKSLGATFYPKRGVKVWDIPILLRKAVVEVIGDRKVEQVKLMTVDRHGKTVEGTEELIDVDFVCISGGLYPLVELAALAGCKFKRIESLGGYVPLHNEKMETNAEGLYVAGNITGIEGAKVAMAQGEVAAWSILNNQQSNSYKSELNEAMYHVRNTRQDAYIQFHPNIEQGRQQLEQLWQKTTH